MPSQARNPLGITLYVHSPPRLPPVWPPSPAPEGFSFTSSQPLPFVRVRPMAPSNCRVPRPTHTLSLAPPALFGTPRPRPSRTRLVRAALPARRSGSAAATPLPEARPLRLVQPGPSPQAARPRPQSRRSLQPPVRPVAAPSPARLAPAMVRPRRAPHRSGAGGPLGGRGRPLRPSRRAPPARAPGRPALGARGRRGSGGSAPPMVSPRPLFFQSFPRPRPRLPLPRAGVFVPRLPPPRGFLR